MCADRSIFCFLETSTESQSPCQNKRYSKVAALTKSNAKSIKVWREKNGELYCWIYLIISFCNKSLHRSPLRSPLRSPARSPSISSPLISPMTFDSVLGRQSQVYSFPMHAVRLFTHKLRKARGSNAQLLLF